MFYWMFVWFNFSFCLASVWLSFIVFSNNYLYAKHYLSVLGDMGKKTKKKDESSHDYAEIIQYYDSIALGYDELHFGEQKEKFEVLKKELNLVINGAGDSVSAHSFKMLDVGCGTFFSYDFFKNYVDEIFGIEPSSKMVDLFIKSHPSARDNVQVGLAEEIAQRFNKNMFDFIICVSVAHHFKNPTVVFKAMNDVSKDSALIGITLLRKTHNFSRLERELSEIFVIVKRMDAGKDVLFVCKKKL
jgi:SAM-dependent methyltransferase